MLYTWTYVKLSALYLMKFFLVIFGHLVLPAHMWSWFKCYLTGWVSINNTLPDSVLPVVSGVPQGSILGPPLFLFYINSISSNVEASKVLKFADDMKCFMTISCDEDHIKLQQDTLLSIKYLFLT